MPLGLVTAATFLGINLIGLLVSWHIERHGLQADVSVQTARRKPGSLRRHMPLIAFNLTMMTVGAAVGMTLLQDAFTTGWPGWTRFGTDLLLLVLIDDLVFYGVHRAMHEHPWLYRTLHRLHHEAYAPVPAEYLYVHPGELSAGTLGVVAGAATIYGLFGTITFSAFLSYTVLRNLHELDIHSGIRSTLAAWVPFLAPNEHHDLHHHQPRYGNYASMLTLWDDIFGTLTLDDEVRGKRRAHPGSASLGGL